MSSAPASTQTPPPWFVQAQENERRGAAEYAARVAAAAPRPADEPIEALVLTDSGDFFRKSIAHSNISRDLSAALARYESADDRPAVTFVHYGGGLRDSGDWFERATAIQHPADVCVLLTFRAATETESEKSCPDLQRPRLVRVTAQWSSAYVRKDHELSRQYCKERYPTDLKEAVAELHSMLDTIAEDLDESVRAELPSTTERLALTPGYRADWQWGYQRGFPVWKRP